MPKKGKRITKLNNKGFTLIEVLAVIVILVIILAIAIPNISASLDRQSCKTTANKIEMIKSAAKLYVSDNRNAVRSKLNSGNSCKITISNTDNKLASYLDEDDLKDGEGADISGSVVVDSSYNYYFCNDNDNCSLNDSSKCENIELNECVSE